MNIEVNGNNYTGKLTLWDSLRNSEYELAALSLKYECHVYFGNRLEIIVDNTSVTGSSSFPINKLFDLELKLDQEKVYFASCRVVGVLYNDWYIVPASVEINNIQVF